MGTLSMEKPQEVLEKKPRTPENIANLAFDRMRKDPTSRFASSISHIIRNYVLIEEKKSNERAKITENLFEQSLKILKEKMKSSIVTREMLREAKGKERGIPYSSR